MLVGYARVSTTDQDHALQVDALKAAGCEKIFTETASGAQRDRPELLAALDYMREGDTLVVWKLDRLARSMSHLISTIEMLEKRSVGFRSLTEAMDTTTAIGKFFFHFFGALAEFERSLIRERTMAGLRAAKARGAISGRPRKFTDADLVAAKALLADGKLTVRDVAKHIGVSEATLYRHLPAARAEITTDK
ncbi:MAG: recombinase family protein [Proteobacteria bacterium]|nr:recombinase family protein [Pseudomonadota bacterium]